MRVNLKKAYDAEQFSPSYYVPNCVVDLLRDHSYPVLKSKGYEWGIENVGHEFEGIHIGDWIVSQGSKYFVFTNEQFKQIFKEAD